MNSPYIQIIGTQRSGSNLLRVMLNAHPQISAPHPPHILDAFFPFLHVYGAPDQIENLKRLCEDVAAFVHANRVPWNIPELNAQNILSHCTEASLTGVVNAVYRIRMKSEQKQYWCCKSMINYRYFAELESCSEKPFYIHLLRDGRAVARSFIHNPVGDKHPYVLGENWNRDQLGCLKVEQEVSSERFYRLHYEELVTDTENQLKKLCDAMEIAFDEKMLHYFETGEAIQTAESGPLWTNLKLQPIAEKISSGNLLDPEAVHLFDCAAKEMLVHFGYPVNPGQNPCPGADEIITIKKLNDELCRKAGVKASLSIAQTNLLNALHSTRHL